MGSSDVIIESELMEGLAGEKIKVTLEAEPEEGVELGAEAAVELEARGVTAAAPIIEEVEEGVMVDRLGIEEVELDMLEVMVGIEAEVIDLATEEDIEVAVEEADDIEVMDEEVMLVAEDEAEDIIEEEATSSMFIDSSSTESDIDWRRSCEAAAGFQSG
jgi:hypothetical protein